MLSPILELEDRIQVKDQTRFDAAKSFKTKGENPFTACLIKPGADGSPVSVFVVDDQEQWYLDWLWADAKFDIEAALHKLYFRRQSTNVEYEVSLTTGTYSYAALVAEIQTQLNAASPLVWAATLSNKAQLMLTVDESVDIMQAENPTINLWPHLGYTYAQSGKDFTGQVIEYGLRKITVTLENLDNTLPIPNTITVTEDFWQKVATVYGDSLFSTDAMMKAHEDNILDWVPAGRSSFINMHRRAQELIMDWVYQAGYTDKDNRRFTKFDVLDIEDVRLWSVYEVLHYLFMSFQNSNSDVFKEKAGYYEKLKIAARTQAALKLDTNKNGKADDFEQKINTSNGVLTRR